MPGVILAVADRTGAAESILAAAAQLALLTGSGRIIVLAIRTPPVATILPSEEVLSRRDELRIREAERNRAAALKEGYDGWAPTMGASNVVAEWSEVEGLADQLIDEWGRRAD